MNAVRRTLTAALMIAGASTTPVVGQAPGDAGGITASGVGAVLTSMSQDDLIALLGTSNVLPSHSYMGEGYCSPGARVFPDSSAEIHVTWTDSSFSSVMEIVLRHPESPWRTPRGVGVGTTLAQLAEIAGAPVEFSGFGWDFGGYAGWEETGLKMILRLAPAPGSDRIVQEDGRGSEIQGDKLVLSDHPLVRKITIRVAEIILPGVATGQLEYLCPADDST